MKYLTAEHEIKDTEKYMQLAAEIALNSTCTKSKSGAVIVKDGVVIGEGYNKVTLEGMCDPCIRGHIHDNSQVELCTAVHAEQLAIMDALKKGNDLKGARMYHVAVKNGVVKPGGELSCTLCSRMIAESGIAEFVLWHEDGYCVYDAQEANKLSFDYFLKS